MEHLLGEKTKDFVGRSDVILSLRDIDSVTLTVCSFSVHGRACWTTSEFLAPHLSTGDLESVPVSFGQTPSGGGKLPVSPFPAI